MPTYLGDDGALLHYDVLGDADAPPVIVLAGGAARHPEYLGDLAGLTDHHRLLVPHLRGVGRSRDAALGERASWWRQAEDVERLRTTAGPARCVLIGHSAGTRQAIAYAARFTACLDALVLITPPASYLVDTPADASAVAATRLGDAPFAAALAAWEAGPDTSGDETFNAWQQTVAALGYARWDAVAQRHARLGGYRLDAARAFLAGEPPADLAARLSAVRAPTLIVAGARDAITGVGPVTAVADLFPAGSAAVIEDSGHYPWVESPAAFRRVVDPFLARWA